MADEIQTRRAAQDAAYDFINKPGNEVLEKSNPALLFAGAFHMIFPRIEIDWGSVEMFAEAFDKMKAADEAEAAKLGGVL